ncbi:MAG: hypothetical protein JW850_23635 [Thermoflexales bacterium]|nr:hypothetical protein [Thermoflexales bacterium]
MFRKISRWLRSKTGKQTLAGVLAVLLIISITGELIGWWNLVPGLGTAVEGPYPKPSGGYSCMPTCAENDGKFISLPGEDMASFGGESAVFWVSVPGDYANNSFSLGFFDGDSGKNTNGDLTPTSWASGNWDNTTTKCTYTLYADPVKDGKGTQQIAQWTSDEMPNNAWFDITLTNVEAAKAPSGHYFYRIELSRPVQGYGINALKLRSNAYLSTGQSDLVNSNFAIVGMIANTLDLRILYPQYQSSTNLGASTYTGDWQFYFFLPNDLTTMEIWDGDFDRGTSATIAPDTKDPNTHGKPEWAGPFAVDERAGGQGAPADNAASASKRREPPVTYSILDPGGEPLYINEEPSGTEEWEVYIISTDPDVHADYTPPPGRIQPGLYRWHIEGLDVHNTVWIRMNYEITPPPYCPETDPNYPTCLPDNPPPVWPDPPEGPENLCPRTIGYWKNNVNKVLIQGKTRGVQESPDSLHAALDAVAKASPLFRSGINVANPQPIATVARLTDAEANMILQRSKKDYPAGADRNSMLARALQQNLATWLNLGSTKIGYNTVIHMEPSGGAFDGSMIEALREAEDYILNYQNDAAKLERAKDIADLINNGALTVGEESDVELSCKEYNEKFPERMPKDKQPPKHKDMPKQPKLPEPPNPTPVPTPDTNTCTVDHENTYSVMVEGNNPFAGLKFENPSFEVKNGAYDEFRLTLPSSEVAALTSVQMEAKAGTEQQIVTLECDFSGGIPCSMMSDNRTFFFSFEEAVDNGDGTTTLVFRVQNLTEHAISHVTIGLPTATPNSGQYTSKVCVW